MINAVGILLNDIIVTASDDRSINLWDLHGKCIKRLDGLSGTITNIITHSKYFEGYGLYGWAGYDLDTEQLETYFSYWKFIELFDRTLTLKHNIAVSVFAGSDTNITFAYAPLTKITFSCLPKNMFPLRFETHQRPITALKISSDGTFIVSGSESYNGIYIFGIKLISECDNIYIWSIRPIIEKLLCDDVSIEDLISILGLNKSSTKCIVS